VRRTGAETPKARPAGRRSRIRPTRRVGRKFTKFTLYRA
jgi:hypothetical protein